ncbi:GAF domain-containing protein [Jiangella endophytica]|uniref:GAF domain-containing protein n=1 Tax=Jiangella endophytica TaxID=1623398 RepID=UPI0018E4FC89|nr:GAF domain-containing protein [Jiangella endophytica]
MRPSAARWSRGLLFGAALAGAVTAVLALVEPYVPVLPLLVFYLLAVLPVAIVWGAGPAAVTSLVSVVIFEFAFLAPVGSIGVADREETVALGSFLLTAVLTTALAVRLRRAAVESVRLTDEQSALRRVATLVAQSVPRSALFEAVTREVGLLSGADLARMERYEADGTVTGVAAWSRVPEQLVVGTRLKLDGVGVAREVRRRGGPVRLDGFAGAMGEIAGESRSLGIHSSVGCPIIVAGGVWGVIAASTRSDEPFPANTEAQIASFTELVATAVENAEARAELHRMAEEQAALRRVATLVAHGVAPDLVLAAVAQELGELTGADITGIFRFESDGSATLMGVRGVSEDEIRVGHRRVLDTPSAIASVQATGESARYDVDDAALERLPELLRGWGIRSAVASPIVVEGRNWGGISVASRHGPFAPDTELRLVEFTEIAATAIANAEAHTKLTQSRARVVTTADETRRRIERDLHDGAQQRLVSLALKLRLALETLPAELGPAVRDDFAEVADELIEVQDELREISRGIHPSILSEGGLGPALRTLARRSTVPVEMHLETVSRYPPPVEVAAYYVVSEALTNVTKHARATHAEVAVEQRDATLRLRVRDDGVGGAEEHHGSGLVGLRDRVEALGGSIDVASPAGQGTVIRVALPLA